MCKLLVLLTALVASMTAPALATDGSTNCYQTATAVFTAVAPKPPDTHTPETHSPDTHTPDTHTTARLNSCISALTAAASTGRLLARRNDKPLRRRCLWAAKL